MSRCPVCGRDRPRTKTLKCKLCEQRVEQLREAGLYVSCLPLFYKSAFDAMEEMDRRKFSGN